MMGGNNNFLLKIHMEEDNNITEIYLNKERRSFTFVNDECVSDLIIPEFKITSLNMILENTNDKSGYESYYAEYEKNGEIEREFDREKIAIIRKMVTQISINDFLNYQNDIKQNDYYIDNVVDAYSCVLPSEMKKILSYTTNGVVFSGEEKIEMMSHDSITKYNRNLKNFIPFMIKDKKNYIGYDYKESLYKEYDEDNLVKSAKTLKELLLNAEKKEESIEELFEVDELKEILDEGQSLAEEEKVEEEYNKTIKNIDLQLERLNAGIVAKKEKKKNSPIKKEPKVIISDELGKEAEDLLVKVKVQTLKNKLENKKKEERKKQVISEAVAKEAEEVLRRMSFRETNKRNQNNVVSDDLGKEAEIVLQKIIAKENKDRENRFRILSEEVAKEAEQLLKRLSQSKEKPMISEEIAKEAQDVLKKITTRENKSKENNTLILSEEVAKEAEDLLNKIKAKENKKKMENVISEAVAKEAEEVLRRMSFRETNKRNQNNVVSDDLGKEAEIVLQKIIAKENKDRENRFRILSEEVAKEAEQLLKRLSQSKEKPMISEEIAKEAQDVLKKITTGENKSKENNTLIISEAIAKEAEDLLNKIKAKENKKKMESVISEAVAKEAGNILNRIEKEEQQKREEIMINNINKKIQSAIIEYEIRESVRENLDEIEKTNQIIDEINATITKVKESEKAIEEEQQKEKISISDLINNSITNSISNYRINLNDTQKLVVEHLPYYEFTNEFDVIQIPEIEFDKITLLPNTEIDFGKIKLIVENLHNDKVDLLVQLSNSIVDKDNNKIKKGTILTLGLKNELTLRLNKKNAMETWSLKMEKSTFEKELRNIDFCKIMNLIKKIDSYKKLGNIEKYELQKSVMLFIDFVMQYNEENKLEKLYEILEKEPTLYEEFITKYNIKHSQEYQDVLSTYEEKKKYVNKLNYVNGLIDAKWLDYPRYIFNSHNYFYSNDFLEAFMYELNNTLNEYDFRDYLNALFDEYNFFKELDESGKLNLDKCLEYLSVLYKYRPDIGEDNKYKIEKAFMIGANEEDIALMISKICRKGIRDYSVFVEYDSMIKEKYRLGDLKYPIYSTYFELDEIRKGGEYDEF